MIAAVLTIVLFAAPSETVSRAHFAKAQKSFTQHDWRRALDEFTAASESAPTELPDLWFDIAQCHRNLGHQRQAAAAFTRYLALSPPDAPDRDKVRALIVSLGGKLDEPAPAPPMPALTAPPVIDPAPAPAPTVETTPVAAAATLPLVPPADAPPPAKAHRHWKLWTGVAVGVAAVALGVGLGVGLGMQNGSSTPPMVPSLGSAATFDTRSH